MFGHTEKKKKKSLFELLNKSQLDPEPMGAICLCQWAILHIGSIALF